MHLRVFVIFVVILSFGKSLILGNTTIKIPSNDEIKISADIYIAHKNIETPFIILFHQAGWSRGEYLEIAPKLNNLGFNCMAVDLRSGNRVNKVLNETAKKAKAADKKTTYVHAIPDIIASINFVRKNYAKGKLIVWGSSYSAALVLKIAGDNPTLVDGVMAFSPGEYFTGSGKPHNWIEKSAANITVPVLIASAKDEISMWESIYAKIQSKYKMSFIPKKSGNHGSRALWSKHKDSNAYWKTVKLFLKQCN